MSADNAVFIRQVVQDGVWNVLELSMAFIENADNPESKDFTWFDVNRVMIERGYGCDSYEQAVVLANEYINNAKHPIEYGIVTL